MKADWALLGSAAAGMLVLPLLVLLWSGTPLGTANSLSGGVGTPQEETLILPGDQREDTDDAQKAGSPAVLESFRILNETTGQVETVSALDYVAGAIAAEMPALYESDALIAQGIASFTNAHYLAALRRADPPEELKGADFAADPAHNLGYMTADGMKTHWGDHYEEYSRKVKAAAAEAMKYLITYEDEPILAAYFAISAGKTAGSSFARSKKVIRISSPVCRISVIQARWAAAFTTETSIRLRTLRGGSPKRSRSSSSISSASS